MSMEQSFLETPHPMSHVKKVVGVVSGKGGVGKSLVTSLLAVLMSQQGYTTAIMDADITGPSIPRAFGITEKAQGNEQGLIPSYSTSGIGIMSMNLLLPNDSDPVVWRGPIIAGTVKQFWTEVAWGEVDLMLVDLPPGTGDVPLTVFQSLPIDGIVIVTTPQELVSMIVEKAVKMAGLLNLPILGLVENMSYFNCPECGKQISLFGESRLAETAARYQIETMDKLPLDPSLTALCDQGQIERCPTIHLGNIVGKLLQLIEE